MNKLSRRFESEVHLGFLAIILVLLVLNAASNYVAYHALMAERERIENLLNDAGLLVSRSIDGWGATQLSEDQEGSLRQQLGLSRLGYFPGSLPSEGKALSRADLFSLVTTGSREWGDIVARFDAIEMHRIIRGDQAEYFYLYPMSGRNARGLIILGEKAPLLSYLDTAWRTMIIVSLVAAFLTLGVYVLVSRFVLSPFRRIRQEALQAGRIVDDDHDEVEAMVTDYRRIIGELREKESELLRLNREITHRADSLEQFNEHLLRSMNSGLVTVNQRGRVMSLNTVAEEILDVERTRYEGRHYWDLLGSNVHLVDAVSRVLDCGRNQAYRETEFTTTSGRQLTLGVTISMIHDHTGAVLGASLLINDLTELSTLRRQLETKERLAALGEMAAGLAHQIRNSLGAVAGYGSLLRKKLIGHDLNTDHAVALVQETKEAESLIERFLYFARPLNFSPTMLEVDTMIRELIDSFRVRSDCAAIEFAYYTNRIQPIEADGLLLKQALTNLLENGVNAHAGDHGTVTVKVTATDEQMMIEVSDTGCGINQSDADKIFTPFYSTRPSGSGLGLPLVKKIVDLHGGQLTFESRAGQGTTFKLSLPLHQANAVPRGTAIGTLSAPA